MHSSPSPEPSVPTSEQQPGESGFLNPDCASESPGEVVKPMTQRFSFNRCRLGTGYRYIGYLSYLVGLSSWSSG